MKRCLPPSWLLAGLLLVLVGNSRATTVIPPDFDRLVDSSDYVVRAVVTSMSSSWRDNPNQPGQRYIGTFVELDVQEVLKGSPPQPLVLDLVGGRIGERELVIDGAPKFAVGQESVLFVRGNGRQIIPLVGLMHGLYPVRRDARTGKNQILRSNGKLLYSEQEVALPESAASAAPTRDPQAQPLSVDEFSARIRQSAKSHERTKLE